VRPFEVLANWWAVVVVVALVASVNVCLSFFCYAPTLVPHDELAPTTTIVELTIPTIID
jgi:hypothetical protein